MIRMVVSTSAAQAKSYFSDALSKSDYYFDGQELQGIWEGKLASRLGLQGSASKEAFFALCDNKHPAAGEQLTPRQKEGRRTGYDINFHCPKSVSILHALSKDNHILDAFRDSVTETMKEIETDCKTRVRIGGTQGNRTTGEMVWGHFVHQTARPVDGHLPDMHVHSHCYVFNITWDDVEQRFKAGEFGDIKRDMPYYQAVFHKRLSDRLQGLGYQIRRTDKSFEVEAVPQKVIDLFSKRTDEIGRVAKEKGITDAKELSELGAKTRAKKQKGHSMAELKEAWKKQIYDLGVEAGDDKIVRHGKKTDKSDLSPEKCVDHALLHCFERASVMGERKILQTALKHSIGERDVSLDEIKSCFRQDKRIIHVSDRGQRVCTTKEVLAEEQRMVELAKRGQDKMHPLYHNLPKIELDGEQKAAVEHVLTTPHRVSIIRGAAGTGKTTLMKEAVRLIEAKGVKVTVVAPSSQASRNVLRHEGFGLAETVAKLMVDDNMKEATKGKLIWVDEAGLLGTKDMLGILHLAEKNNARVILGGDTRQHASVIRGDALRILNTVAGIKTAEVSKIYRQRDERYKAAVKDLSEEKIADGFGKLDAMGSIKAIDAMKAVDTLVDDYMAAIKEGKTGLVVSPTHAQGDRVTEGIRDQMRSEGMIGKREIVTERLRNLQYTEAERQDWRNYKIGHVVQFEQNLPGIKRGSRWEVTETQDKTVRICNSTGESLLLPLHKSEHFSVYEVKELALSKGDRVRITHNGFDADKKRLDNGDILEVVKASKNGEVLLRNGISKATYRVTKDFGHLAHAHCITSYASQGKTVDEVFIWQPASTFGATDAKQFYVSVSRGRDRSHVYTDDKTALLAHASDLGLRQSAIEMVDWGKAQNDMMRQMHSLELGQERKAINRIRDKDDYEPEI